MERPLRAVAAPTGEPLASLLALERSLTDARRVAERLLELPVVDAVAFQASFDLFLRDLGRNAFFRPPDPLEFSNVVELLGPESLGADADGWRSDAARISVSKRVTLGHRSRCSALTWEKYPNTSLRNA